MQRANDSQAELLGVPVGTPVLLARSVTEDEHGIAIEVSDVLYRAERFTFRIESRR